MMATRWGTVVLALAVAACGDDRDGGPGTDAAAADAATDAAVDAATDAPFDAAPDAAAACGNGMLEAGEECDDGNQVPFDACLDTCVAARCGDGVQFAGVEQCDDANDSDTDACLTTCQAARCGDGIVRTGVEECDDGNVINEDACTNNCLPARCGDGSTQPGEECDDANPIEGDGCDSNCRFTACGNGVRDSSEQCDDGNQAPLDGCDAGCRQEQAEVEPNDDGSPSPGGDPLLGNDVDPAGAAVANALAQGALPASAGVAARLARLDPAGDEDLFAITNDTGFARILRVDVWSLAAGFGAGVPCGAAIDTVLHLRRADGSVLATSDDRDAAADRCSGLQVPLTPGATVFAHVLERGDDQTIPGAGYGLAVSFALP